MFGRFRWVGSRLEAIAIRLEAIASGLKAIAMRFFKGGLVIKSEPMNLCEPPHLSLLPQKRLTRHSPETGPADLGVGGETRGAWGLSWLLSCTGGTGAATPRPKQRGLFHENHGSNIFNPKLTLDIQDDFYIFL